MAYYCPEALSRSAEHALRAESAPGVSNLTHVEFLSALSRKMRQRELRRADAERIADEFQTHYDSDLYTRISIVQQHYDHASMWVRRFGTPIRTLDVLHLAAADSEGLLVVTADVRMARSARVLGVRARLL